jgi:uncharacterized protein involved in response to NO
VDADGGKTSSDAGRAYGGPEILRAGFRPFFLAAGIWSAVAVLLWLGALSGVAALPTAFDPALWHGHEMLFGFLAAVIAGFLLTAIPNWTGRLPLRGPGLALLVGLWALGRAAVGVSALTGPLAAAVLDLTFPAAFCAVVLREILAGRSWRNLPIAGVLAVLFAGNLLTHLEPLGVARSAGLGLRLGIATVAVLITLVGGRVVPSFTRNWLAKRGAQRLPRPFGGLDRLAILSSLAAGLAWTLAPAAPASGALALLAAVLGGVRLAGWLGHRTLAEPLVWVMHLGYAWLVLGWALLGAAILLPGLDPASALHALTAGAMGTMTLAIMTRASLGHSGRPLSAGKGTTLCYGLVGLAALTRILAPLVPEAAGLLFELSGLAWIGAFGLFAILYGPLLLGLARR